MTSLDSFTAGPPRLDNPGPPATITRSLGPLTVYVQGGASTSETPWLALVVVNAQFRLGQMLISAKDLARFGRFPVALWDSIHKRWAKRRTLKKAQLLGLVKADDPGLDELGIERWSPPFKSGLIAVGV